MTKSRTETLTGSAVQIQIVSPSPVKRIVPGVLRQVSNESLWLDTDSPILCGTVLAIENDDTLFVGEVVAFGPADENRWNVWMKLHDRINNLESLSRHHEALLGDYVSRSDVRTQCRL